VGIGVLDDLGSGRGLTRGFWAVFEEFCLRGVAKQVSGGNDSKEREKGGSFATLRMTTRKTRTTARATEEADPCGMTARKTEADPCGMTARKTEADPCGMTARKTEQIPAG
jgi:hypothetical protein